MSGRTAKARRRAEAAAAPQTKKPRAVQAPKRRVDPVRERRKRLAIWSGVAAAAAVAGLYGLTAIGGSGGGGASAGGDSGLQGSGEYVYAVGAPGPGQAAPPIELAGTGGDAFNLAAYRGKEQVLLYFQEGLMCQPCWDQIVAIEKEMPAFKKLGINRMVSITGDPLHLLDQKIADEAIKSPVLSDAGYTVSDTYDARTYGMMNGQMAGHSFILVGKDGKIRWRADYGGEPNYTMFVPTEVLLQHLRQGIKQPA